MNDKPQQRIPASVPSSHPVIASPPSASNEASKEASQAGVRVWTTLDLINWTKTFFEKKGLENPRLETELLLAEVLGCPRIRLYVDFEKPVSAENLAKFRDFVKRRGEKREPLQYILGNTQFIDLKIKVSPAALIPRPETEILAVWAAERLKEIQNQASEATNLCVLDLCTGTGCIALYIASKALGAQVVASDLSMDALALARENAAALTLTERVTFIESDLFSAFEKSGETEAFDVIVTNPPYIDENARGTLQPEVRDFEPPAALFAAEEGLAISRRIINDCDCWLKPGGWLGLEFGIGQHDILREIAAATEIFDAMLIEKDGSQIPRFLHAQKRKA